MLPNDVHKLAQSSFLARRAAALTLLEDELRKASADQGNVSSPGWARRVIDLATQQVYEDAEAAGEEIIRACRSKGTRYRDSLIDEMRASFDALVPKEVVPAMGTAGRYLSTAPNKTGAIGDAAGSFERARIRGELSATAQFAHFAAELKRTEAESRAKSVRQFARDAGMAAIGAALAKSPEAISWLAQLFRH